MNAAQRSQLTRCADLSRRTEAATGRHLTLVPPPSAAEDVDAGLPSRAFTLAEEILDDASIGTDDRDLLLTILSPREQPGPYVEHAVECHRLWVEALPDTTDEQTANRARNALEIAIRELVSAR